MQANAPENKMVGATPPAARSNPSKVEPSKAVDVAPPATPVAAPAPATVAAPVLPRMGDFVLFRNVYANKEYERVALVVTDPDPADPRVRLSLNVFEISGPTSKLAVPRGTGVGEWRPRD